MSDNSRENIPDVDYFDCSDKPDGTHIHPTDCTRYIQCGNGRAFDMACPDCDSNNPACAGQAYLYYDAEVQRCELPSETRCITEAKPAG